jgi:hypothetical protein
MPLTRAVALFAITATSCTVMLSVCVPSLISTICIGARLLDIKALNEWSISYNEGTAVASGGSVCAALYTFKLSGALVTCQKPLI